MPRVSLTKEFEFEASHHLVGYKGACARVHGHSYKLQVTVSGEISPRPDYSKANECMVIDFKDLKKVVETSVINIHDHEDLNGLYDNPTAEVMVVSMFKNIQKLLPVDVRLESVKLWETSTSFAEFRGDLYE